MFSHPIIGETGNMSLNCKKAEVGMERVQKLFPEVVFYVPGNQNLALQILIREGHIGEGEILSAEFEIIRSCHGWCYYRFEDSFGSEKEREVAIECGLIKGDEHDIGFDLGKCNYNLIRKTFTPIVEKAIAEYRRRKNDG